MKNSPCLDCENRQIGCHGSCVPYQDYSAERRKISELRRQYNEKETRYIESKTRLKKASK
jgi:hypothetical protein